MHLEQKDIVFRTIGIVFRIIGIVFRNFYRSLVLNALMLIIVFVEDFIRTFTWDKKLEMYVKSTGILGGQGKMPTVVSPELYRERFCEAMQRYFLMIPNKWFGLGNEQK